MFTLYEWISLAQWVVMGVATLLLWRLRTSVQDAVNQASHERRLTDAETEIERLRKWRHEIIVPWQQELIGRLDEKFVTRREWDQARGDESPWPNNRRNKPR